MKRIAAMIVTLALAAPAYAVDNISKPNSNTNTIPKPSSAKPSDKPAQPTPKDSNSVQRATEKSGKNDKDKFQSAFDKADKDKKPGLNKKP